MACTKRSGTTRFFALKGQRPGALAVVSILSVPHPSHAHRALAVYARTMTTSGPAVTVTALDHIVLGCADVATTMAWYTDVLGLEALRVDEWRDGTVSFPSVRIDEATIIDLVEGQHESTRLDHVCIVIEQTDMDALAASPAFDVVQGPVTRWGARGDATSVYVRDPDGGIVELRHY